MPRSKEELNLCVKASAENAASSSYNEELVQKFLRR